MNDVSMTRIDGFIEGEITTTSNRNVLRKYFLCSKVFLLRHVRKILALREK